MSEENKHPLPRRPEEKIRTGSKDLFEGITDFFRTLVDLNEGLDREGTIISIKNNKRMRGANAWLLMCSIMIASLGLDLGSPAVIIGAMLISPLMSPILGVGLAIGINDKEMLWIAVQHFLIAIGIAIITSYIFFRFITPFGEVTPEIESRTAPTLLDVLVAFFGGLAGIISGSRRDVSNAIPGVAIATALMPPLCVTGFGLATRNYEYALNSFYLFFLNSTFIALATYIIVRVLNFPHKHYPTRREDIRTRWLLLGISVVLILPSARILRDVLVDINRRKSIETFLDDNFENAICQTRKDVQTDSFYVKIFLFDPISEEKQETYREQLRQEYKAPNTRLRFFASDIPEFDTKQVEANIRQEVINLMEAGQKLKTANEEKIELLSRQIDSLLSADLLRREVSRELEVLFPGLRSHELYLEGRQTPADSSRYTPPLLLADWKSKTYQQQDEDRLRRYIIERCDLDTLIIAH